MKNLSKQFSSTYYNRQLKTLRNELNEYVNGVKGKQTEAGRNVSIFAVRHKLIKIIELISKAEDKGKFNPELSSILQTCTAVNPGEYCKVLAYLLKRSEERNYFINHFNKEHLINLLNNH